MFICKILLVADIGITSVAVLGRYVPFMPDPAWSEEIGIIERGPGRQTPGPYKDDGTGPLSS